MDFKNSIDLKTKLFWNPSKNDCKTHGFVNKKVHGFTWFLNDFQKQHGFKNKAFIEGRLAMGLLLQCPLDPLTNAL